MFRRFIASALCFAVVFSVFAAVNTASAQSRRHAAMALDANTGAVLHNEQGDELRHPASLTKIMTLYLAFEALESGRFKMSDRVIISRAAASVAPSKLDLDPGESLSVAEAIKALVTKSANDVAVALAERIGGSEAAFVRLMNAKARDLGMMKTNFENASGLPDNRQVTTARDMITLALRIQDHYPQYYSHFATRSFAFRGKTYRNHNTMLNNFSGVDGIKTGYTRASGFNLVSSVHRGGRHVIAAVFGGASAATRNGEMRVIFTRALTRASTVKTRKPQPLLVAKLKSAPRAASRPTVRKDPAPLQVAEARASQPRPFAPAPAAVAAPKPVAAPSPVAAEAAPAPRIEVFKVKPVLMAPRQGNTPPADETTDVAPLADDAPSSPPPQQPPSYPARFAVASSAPAARQPTELDAHLERLEAAAEAAPQEEPFQERSAETLVPRFVTASALSTIAQPPSPQPRQDFSDTPRRGTPPSTLQAQAMALGAGRTQLASLNGAPARTQGTSVRGAYEIQIGAYASMTDAARSLAAVQNQAERLLAGYQTVTQPIEKDGRQIYRARFTGFDSQRAASTCTELRRHSIDCFVMAAQ